MNVTEAVAGLVAATRYEDLPSAAINLAKPLILDSLAVSIAGSAGSLGQITLKVGSETVAAKLVITVPAALVIIILVDEIAVCGSKLEPRIVNVPSR